MGNRSCCEGLAGQANMRNRSCRFKSEQVEMFTFGSSNEAAKVDKVGKANGSEPAVVLTGQALIDELRNRLRRSEAARFGAESRLAIVTEERNCLAEKLRKLRGGIYGVLKNT